MTTFGGHPSTARDRHRDRSAHTVVSAFPGELRSVIARDAALAPAVKADASLSSLIRDIDNTDCRLGVIDPSGLRGELFLSIVDHAATAGISLIIFAPLTRATVQRVLEAQRYMNVEVIFRDFDDAGSALRRSIRSLGELSVPSAILGHLAPQLQKLPLEVTLPTVALFGWAPLPESVAQFARDTRRDLRSVERYFRAQLLCTPRTLLHVARVARAHVFLRNASVTLSEAADAVGYRSPRLLSRYYRAMAGITTARRTTAVSDAEVIRRLVQVTQSQDEVL